MNNWSTGRNMAGYLPESAPFVTDDWTEAVNVLIADMEEFADEDDDRRWEEIAADGEEPLGDEYPTTLATVRPILKDDGPSDENEWACWVEDNQGLRWEFWLHATDEPVSDDDED